VLQIHVVFALHVSVSGEFTMTISTFPTSSRTKGKKDLFDSNWTGDLTKSEAEVLLDWLEQIGFPDLEVRCTSESLFAVHLPGKNKKHRKE
jgi:hypothetical protein